MVNPILLIALPLGAAFCIPLIGRIGEPATRGFFVLVILLGTILSTFVLVQVWGNPGTPIMVHTAGFLAPLSINLRFGVEEAVLVTAIHLIVLISGLLILPEFSRHGERGLMLYLGLLTGLIGIVTTRDLFNLFVFLEVTAIALYGLIPLSRDHRAVQAGFKYAIAGGIASVLYLIGTIFVYRAYGSLNLDSIATVQGAGTFGVIPFVASFLLVMALVIESKPFPANGWALDVYEAASGDLSAVISTGAGTAVVFAVYKIAPILPPTLTYTVAGAGMVTFLVSNLMANKQSSIRRMLGYSSAAQIGLLLFVVTGLGHLPSSQMMVVGGGFILGHLLAKAGLFWLSESRGESRYSADTTGRLVMGILIFALACFPPFPGFWAKWRLVQILWSEARYWQLGFLLAGSLFEVVYLMRWLGSMGRSSRRPTAEEGSLGRTVAAAVIAVLVAALGTWMGLDGLHIRGPEGLLIFAPLAAAALVPALSTLPLIFRGLLSAGIVSAYAYYAVPRTEGIAWFFTILFLGVGILQSIAGIYRRGERRTGYYPGLLLVVLGAANLLSATASLEFLLSWEFMAIGGYLLVARGRNGEGPGVLYVIFSAGGAYLLMAGLAASGSFPFSADYGFERWVPVILLSLAFLAKAGALGLHIWLPGAYTEADDDGSSLLSAGMSKAAVLGLFLVVAGLISKMLPVTAACGMELFSMDTGALLDSGFQRETFLSILGWVGAATALGGTFSAVFQEDIKTLLAYSSIGQLGYIIVGISLGTHAGFTAALYLTLLHTIFKGMLFLTVAGIIYRTGTRDIYKMGGLIKRMPVSFLGVLMAIIAVSGVPPLAGFGSKWLIYTALLEGGRYLQLAVMMFTSTMAFLYLFRLIHGMFLGQPKPEHRTLKEAPVWLLIPVVVLMGLLMGISMFPQSVLKPIHEIVSGYVAGETSWQGVTLVGPWGYWSGRLVMYIVMGVFGLMFVWLALIMRRPRHILQFNIVFAAERPDKPHTTHYAYNFFAPYRRAFGILTRPYALAAWRWGTEAFDALAGAVRRIYTGNGQTYALHILIYMCVLYAAAGGYGW